MNCQSSYLLASSCVAIRLLPVCFTRVVRQKGVLWFKTAFWGSVQVFSFSSNAMPDDISVMTMAGERTRSGPPDDVKQ